jgi:hypothetical protein
MTKGVVLGHDLVRLHHLFAWPAFALIFGLATWRVLGTSSFGGRVPAGYLLVVGIAAVLVLGAGYWGGEMMLAR